MLRISKFTAAVATLAPVAASVLLGACTPQRSALFADAITAPASAPASVPDVHVLAADVVVVNGRHFRLADIAAPQASPHARCLAEALGARQGRLRLVETVKGAQKVTVMATGKRDDHDREIAHLFFDGVDPAGVLISEGLAAEADGARVDWCGPISNATASGRKIAMLSFSGS